jgi:hypothetical protein
MWGQRFILGVMIGLALCGRAEASAWNPAPGQGELISGYVFIDADKAIDGRGQTIELTAYNKQMVQNYGIVGLTPRWAALATFDWQDGQIVQPGLNLSYSEPSSITAGLQYQISRREGHAMALALSYVEGIDLPDQLLTLENRRSSVELRWLWGESETVLGQAVFGELQIAGRMTFDGEYDSTHMQLTLGHTLSERATLLAKGRHADIAAGEFKRLAIFGQTRWEAEAAAVYRFRKRDFIELSYTSVFAGRNTVLVKEIKVGFWRKF